MRAGRDLHVHKFSAIWDRMLKLTAAVELCIEATSELRFAPQNPLLWMGSCYSGSRVVCLRPGSLVFSFSPPLFILICSSSYLHPALADHWSGHPATSSGSWSVPGSVSTRGSCIDTAFLSSASTLHPLCSPILGVGGGAWVSDLLIGDFSDSPFQTLTSQLLMQLSKIWFLCCAQAFKCN